MIQDNNHNIILLQQQQQQQQQQQDSQNSSRRSFSSIHNNNMSSSQIRLYRRMRSPFFLLFFFSVTLLFILFCCVMVFNVLPYSYLYYSSGTLHKRYNDNDHHHSISEDRPTLLHTTTTTLFQFDLEEEEENKSHEDTSITTMLRSPFSLTSRHHRSRETSSLINVRKDLSSIHNKAAASFSHNNNNKGNESKSKMSDFYYSDDQPQQHQSQHQSTISIGWTPSLYPNPIHDPLRCNIQDILQNYEENDQQQQQEQEKNEDHPDNSLPLPPPLYLCDPDSILGHYDRQQIADSLWNVTTQGTNTQQQQQQQQENTDVLYNQSQSLVQQQATDSKKKKKQLMMRHDNKDKKSKKWKAPPIEIAVAVVRKINLEDVLRADSYFVYEDEDDMVDDAAQYFARYLHNSWELTHPTTNGGDVDTLTSPTSPSPSGILIFLSIRDRVCFISTNNKLARTVLPWWRIEKIIVDMKPHIRKYDYTSAILTAISKIEYYVNIEGPPTFSEKVNDFFMRFGFLLTFALLTFVFAIWGEANAAYYYGGEEYGQDEHNSASLSLNNYLVNSSTILRNHRVSKILQQKRLKAMEKKSRLSPQEFRKAYRKQKDHFKCSYCPICLEPFQSVKVSIMRQNKNKNNINTNNNNREGRESEPLLQTSASSPYQYLCTPVPQTTTTATTTPTTLIDDTNNNDNNEQKEKEEEETIVKKCSILVGSDGVPIKLLRCGHVFDYECWRCWVSFGQGGDIHLCPICRQAIHSTPSSLALAAEEEEEEELKQENVQQYDEDEESNNEPLLLFYTHQYQHHHQQQIQSSMRDAATNVDNTGGENLILNHFQSYGAL